MKVIMLLTGLLLSCTLNAQKIWQEIDAEINSENYKKADRLLDRAAKTDWGWCGNSHMNAHVAIKTRRALILYKQEKIFAAAECLNEIYSYEFSKMDSVKTAYYIEVFGKDEIKHQIDSCLQDMVVDGLCRKFTERYHCFGPIYMQPSFCSQPFIINIPEYNSFVKLLNELHTEPDFELHTFICNQIRKLPFYTQML